MPLLLPCRLRFASPYFFLYLLLWPALLLHGASAWAQTGTYTINSMAATGGTNFSSFTEAINALNSGSITGAATFNASAGQTFPEIPPVLTATGTSSAPIVFQRSGSGANPVLSVAATPGAALDIQGGDYLTFTGIDIAASGAGPTYGYRIRNASGTNGATNNTIQNATITLNRSTAGTVGTIITSNSNQGGVTPTAASGANATNKLLNLSFTNTANGIWQRSGATASASLTDYNTEIAFCTVGAVAADDIGGTAATAAAYGISADAGYRLSVHDNIVRSVTSPLGAVAIHVPSAFGTGTNFTNAGIPNSATNDASNVYNNTVSAISYTGTNTALYARGIYAGTYTSGSHTLNVYNNVISGLTTNGPASASATTIVAGLYAFTSSGATTSQAINFIFNTVYLALSTGTTATSTCFYLPITGGQKILVQNNLFTNATSQPNGTVAKHYTWWSNGVSSTGPTGSISNFNDLFISNQVGSTGFIGFLNGAAAGSKEQATLANWQAATSQDASSVSLDPVFTASLKPTSTRLDNKGTALGIATDIAGATRSGTTPDVGAYEFEAADTTPPIIVYTSQPANTISTADQTVVATITDVGSGVAAGSNSPRLYYRKNSGAYASVVGSASGSTYTFMLPASSLGLVANDVVQYYIAAQDVAATPNSTSNPAGNTSANPPGGNATTFAGTPASYTIVPLLSGPLYVGSGQAYSSLTGSLASGGLFAAINGSQLAGSVQVYVTSNLSETGEVALNQFDAAATLTIQADGTVERLIAGTYVGSGTASLNGLIRLNGADNVTFSGGTGTDKLLRLRNTDTAPVLLLLNGANGNTVTNATIEGGASSSVAGTIALDGSTANSSNTFANSDIRDRTDVAGAAVPANAVYASGTNSAVTIRGNTIRNFSGAGVFTASTSAGDGWVIGGDTPAEGNRIYQEAGRSTTLYGVQLQTGNAHKIRYNSVYQKAGALTGAAFYGLYLTGGGAGHVVSNNTVGGAEYDASGAALTTSGVFIGIYLPALSPVVATAALVQANTVKNLTSTYTTTSSRPENAGLYVARTAGAAILGGPSAELGNVVSNITVSHDFYGISVDGASGVLAIQNNTVSTVRYTATRSVPLLYGIYAYTTIPTATPLASNTLSNLQLTGTSARAVVAGIVVDGSSNFAITSNSISSVGTSGGGSNHSVFGINAFPTIAYSGAYSVTNNTVSALSNGSNGTGSTYSSTTAGIALKGSSVTATGNTLSNIRNTATAATTGSSYVQAEGLEVGTTGPTTISQNRIYNVRNQAQAASSANDYDGAQGIVLYGSSTEVVLANNQVAMPASTTASTAVGILDASTGAANKVYYNTVCVAGTSAGNSYAYRRTKTAAGLLRNNIFYNEAAGGSTSNYAVGSSTATSWTAATSNYNLLVVADNGKVANWLGTALSFAAWKAATGGDASSLSEASAALPNARLFADASFAAGVFATGNLSTNPANAEAWYANGNGVQLADISGDYATAAGARSVATATGAPDIGSTEFVPTATPPALAVSAAPALGGTQVFSLGGRTLASILYQSTGRVPSAVAARYYSGTNPPAPFAAGARYQNAYFVFADSGDGNGFTYIPTLTYDPALLGTIGSETAQRVSQQNSTATGYATYLATLVNPTARTLDANTALPTFGLLTASDQAAPLPVELRSFAVERQGHDAALAWTTASERGNRGFEVQVSTDGRTFRPLGFVAGAGTSSAPRRYAYLDRETDKTGLRYYRLRQIDFSGANTFSPVRTLAFERPAETALRAVPNPFGNEFTLTVQAHTAQPAALLTIVDALGRPVRQSVLSLPAGTSQLPVTGLEVLMPGLYVVHVLLEGQLLHLKVLKH